MSSSEQRAQDIEVAVQEVITILRHHGEGWWAEKLEAVLELINRRDAVGLDRLLALFGGMGSLNDLVLSRHNGHSIAEAEEKAANEALSAHLNRAFVLAREVVRNIDLRGGQGTRGNREV